MKKDLVLEQDFRAILSKLFDTDYESVEYKEVSNGGQTVDVMIEPSTGKVSLVEQGWGKTYEAQNFDYKCIAVNRTVQFEEDLEDIIESYFEALN